MFRLEDLTLFVRAAALGSFSDAAREAGQQPAQVSAAIKRLETILNIRLFARSTRSLRLTPEGETWLPYATQMLDTLEAGLQKIQTPDDEIRGMLQIAVPSDLGRNLLLTLFRDFRQRHPALRLRLLFSDQLTDVFKDPVDVAFRYGNNDDASFISLPVAPENRRVLVASPEWIARHGEPQTLQELGQHNALIYILRGRPFDRWSLSLDGEVQQQKVSGTVMSDDAEVIRRLAPDVALPRQIEGALQVARKALGVEQRQGLPRIHQLAPDGLQPLGRGRQRQRQRAIGLRAVGHQLR